MNRLRKPFAVVTATALAATIAACGGGGGDEDPEEVLQATFSNQESVESGVFDLSVELVTEGGENEGSASASIGGPFDGAGEGFPAFDIQAEGELDTSLQDLSGSAGLTSTGEAGFVSFQGTDYAVPAQAFNEFATTFTQLQAQTAREGEGNDSNFLSSLGVDPTRWLTDVSNEGDEDVEGTETIHISGQADVPALIEDLKTIAENAPEGAQQVTPEQLGDLDELDGLIESADFDIYSGKDDDSLRRIDASIALDPAAAGTVAGSPDSVSVDFSLTFSDLNQPQEIAAPSDPQPIQGLVQQFEALGQLGGLGGGGSASGSGGGGGAAAPQTGGGAAGSGAATGAPSGPAADYLECLAQGGPDAVEECESLRP